MKQIILVLIHFYQKTSFFHKQIFRALFMTDKVCKFIPTCSEYTYLTIEKYGSIKGLWLGFKRIIRCHPWSKGGVDPIPRLNHTYDNKQEEIIVLCGLIGLILTTIGLIAAFIFHFKAWYSFFVIGTTLFFSFINYLLKKKTSIYLLLNNKNKIIKQYLKYFLAGLVIDRIGRFLLFWHYPSFGLFEEIIHVYIIGYPIALFSIYETIVLFNNFLINRYLLIFITTLFNSFFHEFPNTYAWEWIYTIPIVKVEILKINTLVIFAWIILILASSIGSGLKYRK